MSIDFETKEQLKDLSKAWDHIYSGYMAAQEHRFQKRLTGVVFQGSGADFHIRSDWEFYKMIERMRAHDRDDAVVGQGITRLVDNVIQDGPTLHFKTGDKEFDKLLHDRFMAWALDPASCDYERENDFQAIRSASFRSGYVVDGDIFHLLRSDDKDGVPRIQTLEAHRAKTPPEQLYTRVDGSETVHGVELDKSRRRIRYHFTESDIGAAQIIPAFARFMSVEPFDQVGNRVVLHVRNPKRYSQTRGVSALLPANNFIDMHDRTQLYKLIQQETLSAIAILEKLPGDSITSLASLNAGPAGLQTKTDTKSDGTEQKTVGLQPGAWYKSKNDLSAFSANVGNAEWLAHTSLILNIISLNIGIPLIFFLMDARETNFSGWRGADNQFRVGAKKLQRRHVRQLDCPVVHWWVAHQIRFDDEIQIAFASAQRRMAGEDFAESRHIWTPQGWDYIQPEQDAKADECQIENNLNSHQRIQSRRGNDWGELSTEIVEGHGLLIRKALLEAREINDEFPEAKLDWREVAKGYGLDQPNPNTNANLAANAISKQKEDAPDDSDE